jgi:hypothetical protein
MLEFLREEKPLSLRAIAIMLCSPGHWQPWSRFVEAVKTGKAQSIAALGRSHFDHFAANPAEAAVFSRAMQANSELVQSEVVRLVDAKSMGTVVDVGGANGALVCALAAAHPSLKGIVYDLPHARESAVAYIARQGLAELFPAISSTRSRPPISI